jgi:hypothetical protein
MSALKDQIERLPRRIEALGGQQFSYVKLDDVLALVEQPVAREHQWEFYANGSFCKVCGVAIGSGTPCR